MKKLSVSLSVVGLAVGMVLYPAQGVGQAAPNAGSRPLWRAHFAGRAALAQGTNATMLKLIEQLPVTAALRSQIASNLARAPREFWQKDLPAGVPDAAELWRPLFDDLLQAESILEVRGPAGRTETALAIQLNDDRARIWSTNLWKLTGLWKLGEPRAASVAGGTGWESKRAQAPSLVQFVRAGQWVVVGLGPEKLTLAGPLLESIARGGRPAALTLGSLLEVQADLPALGAWFPVLTRYGLPPIALTARGRGEHLRTEIQFQFPNPVRWQPEPWRIPTNMVGEPLTSFTVARGLSALLPTVPGLAQLGLSPLPSQFCAWGVSNEHCCIYLSVPVQSAPAAVGRLALSVPPFIETNLGQTLGDYFYTSNHSYFVWRNIPFVQPYLQPITNAGQHYVHAGLFPLPNRLAPVPPDLYSQLGARANLLYYDWEITSQRIWNGRLFFDLVNILSKRYPQPSGSASKMWLHAITTELWRDVNNPNQSVTEITQTAPNELLLVRKSHLGLTGFELASLSAWLDNPGFPFHYVPPKLAPERGPNVPGAKVPGARPPGQGKP